MQLNGDIIVIDEGKVLQTGSAKEVFENPATAKVAEITNDPAMNINKGHIQDNTLVMNNNVQIQIPDQLKSIPNGDYQVGIRATDLYLDDNGFSFDIECWIFREDGFDRFRDPFESFATEKCSWWERRL